MEKSQTNKVKSRIILKYMLRLPKIFLYVKINFLKKCHNYFLGNFTCEYIL